MRALFDTNILIDYLNGVEAAKDEIAKFSTRYISIISWMEVMVGIRDPHHSLTVRQFLHRFSMISIDFEISELAVKIRQQNTIRLPDAIIWASAEKTDSLLVTRNSKDFPSELPFVRIPYRL